MNNFSVSDRGKILAPKINFIEEILEINKVITAFFITPLKINFAWQKSLENELL